LKNQQYYNMANIKVHLYERLTRKGKISLYLDFYPGIRDPKTKKHIRRKTIGIELYTHPKNEFEKEYNNEMRNKAEAIKGMYLKSIINEEYGFLDDGKQKADFLDYFYEIAKSKGNKWIMVYFHFDKFTAGKCTFGDLNPDLCQKFSHYLLNTKQLKNKEKKLSQNSASAYFRTFRAILKKCYKEKHIRENINDFLDGIKENDVKKEYLTLEEVKLLANSVCEIPVLKSAVLFSCLTGLRISDIISLKWDHITASSANEFIIRKCLQKGKKEETIPISTETLAFCGERDSGIVFKGLKRTMIYAPLKNWIESAGIRKHITFHCFRHTNATLLLSSGIEIYTVSKMLSHENVKTTQIYANLVDKKKIEAANAISLIEQN